MGGLLREAPERGAFGLATVLVCEDEEPLRRLIRAVLELEEHRIVDAADGGRALELLRLVRPELVILDVMLPDRSGLDVLRELRRRPETAATPVLMLSARVQAADRADALAGGADGYLPKPFALEELTAAVTELLESRA